LALGGLCKRGRGDDQERERKRSRKARDPTRAGVTGRRHPRRGAWKGAGSAHARVIGGGSTQAGEACRALNGCPAC